MTILVGFSFGDGAILIADNKNVGVDQQGNLTGQSSTSQKIDHIKKNIVMSTAGLGDVGESVQKMLKSALNVNPNISVQESLPYVTETMKFGQSLFSRVNPEVTYLDMVALVGGFDKDNNSSFLYGFSSANDFKAERIEGQFIVLGAGSDYVHDYIQKNYHTVKEIMDVVRICSEAIRNLEEESVSKDITAIISFYQHFDDSFRTRKVVVDENGVIV